MSSYDRYTTVNNGVTLISNEYRTFTGKEQFQGIYNVVGLFYSIRMKVYAIDLQPSIYNQGRLLCLIYNQPMKVHLLDKKPI